jgi:hypothetical protein
MYCQSCQTKLSPRDENCPTCGRSARGKRELGSSSATSGGGKQSYPLPPATSTDPSSSGTTLPKADAPAREASPRPDSRQAERRRPAPARSSAREASSGLRVSPAEVRRMLVARPSLIEAGLEIYREDGEAVGAGYSTAVGAIDLLARDDSSGWVVVAVAGGELGKDIVSDVLQRMGWVRRHLAESGEEVRGIVLLDSLPDDLGYAAAAVSDTVEFKLYELALTLESVIV